MPARLCVSNILYDKLLAACNFGDRADDLAPDTLHTLHWMTGLAGYGRIQADYFSAQQASKTQPAIPLRQGYLDTLVIISIILLRLWAVI
jgi:hypothetical protein